MEICLPTNLRLADLQTLNENSITQWDDLEVKVPRLTEKVEFYANTPVVAHHTLSPDEDLGKQENGAQTGLEIRIGILTIRHALGDEYVASQIHQEDPSAFIMACAQMYQDRMTWIDVDGEINPIAMLAQYAGCYGYALGTIREYKHEMSQPEPGEDEVIDVTFNSVEVLRDIYSVLEGIDLPRHYWMAIQECIEQDVASTELLANSPTFH